MKRVDERGMTWEQIEIVDGVATWLALPDGESCWHGKRGDKRLPRLQEWTSQDGEVWRRREEGTSGFYEEWRRVPTKTELIKRRDSLRRQIERLEERIEKMR